MDLISAIDDAKAKSLKSKGKIYIIVDADGECSISNAPLAGVTHAFSKGVEVPLPEATKGKKVKEKVEQQEENVSASVEEKPKKQKVNSKSKTNKKMATSKKAKPAKKAAKKSKTVAKDRPAVKGVNKTLTVKAMLSEIKKGSRIFRKEDSAPLPEGYLAKMKDQTREMEVTIVAAEKE